MVRIEVEDLLQAANEGNTEVVELREGPEAVLEAVDIQLSALGLEVVLIETNQDACAWRIVPRGTVQGG